VLGQHLFALIFVDLHVSSLGICPHAWRAWAGLLCTRFHKLASEPLAEVDNSLARGTTVSMASVVGEGFIPSLVMNMEVLESLEDRFLREGRASARVRHPITRKGG
jgi:hypothetical protein